jgi:hypothetical protein
VSRSQTNRNRESGTAAAPQPAQTVEASFIFLDSLNKPIPNLTVKISEANGSNISAAWNSGATVQTSPVPPSLTTAPPKNTLTVVTDKDGLATTIRNATRGQPIEIFVKKTNDQYDLKGTVVPKNDINAYTIVSPEYHFDATTKLAPKEELELDLKIPAIKDGEVMTISRLIEEFGPYIGSVIKVSEVGKVLKDFPTRKRVSRVDSATGKNVTDIEIEHQYRVVKTERPRTVVINILPSRLNYPVSTTISETTFSDMAKRLECEVPAIKAITFTETAGKGFIENGLPTILFERHKFFGFTRPANGTHPYAKFPDICHPNPGGYGAGGIHQYERLVKAARLDLDAALKSCSWGAFQVMGEYYSNCGYDSAADMVDACMRSIDAHALIFENYLKKEKKKAAKALKSKDWIAFTSAYNGGNWEKQNPDYPTKMEEYYNDLVKAN